MHRTRSSKIKYPMIGDPTGAITRNFDVMIEEEGLALRGTFVINPEGKIKVAEIHDFGIGRDAKELLRKVQAAQYVPRTRAKSAPPSGLRALSRPEPRRWIWSARSKPTHPTRSHTPGFQDAGDSLARAFQFAALLPNRKGTDHADATLKTQLQAYLDQACPPD
jgi:hypothetical protein